MSDFTTGTIYVFRYSAELFDTLCPARLYCCYSAFSVKFYSCVTHKVIVKIVALYTSRGCLVSVAIKNDTCFKFYNPQSARNTLLILLLLLLLLLLFCQVVQCFHTFLRPLTIIASSSFSGFCDETKYRCKLKSDS